MFGPEFNSSGVLLFVCGVLYKRDYWYSVRLMVFRDSCYISNCPSPQNIYFRLLISGVVGL